MTKVRMHTPDNEKDAAAMLALLAKAGCEVVGQEDLDAQALPMEEDSEASEGCHPLVVLLPQNGVADAAFDEAVLTAVQGGCRVIGLWPSDGTGGVPACFDDYGGDTVPWNPDQVGRAASGKPQHRTADDAAAEAPDTERHVCE